MKDIKELIFAAVEENAVKFQELAYDQLHARAYEAIESLRPEVAASMFGEAKEMEDDEESEDEDDKDEKKSEKKSEVDEELKGNQHKIDKNKNGKIDAHDFKLLRKEEAEQIDELSKTTLGSYIKKASGKAVQHAHAQVQADVSADANPKVGVWKDMARHHGDKKWKRMTGIRKATDKLTKEETDIQEVAHPQNQADWQALINHQIKVTGHPVATDAQFRAPHGKDTSKIASQEPPEDKINYAKAQGGTVKP